MDKMFAITKTEVFSNTSERGDINLTSTTVMYSGSELLVHYQWSKLLSMVHDGNLTNLIIVDADTLSEVDGDGYHWIYQRAEIVESQLTPKQLIEISTNIDKMPDHLIEEYNTLVDESEELRQCAHCCKLITEGWLVCGDTPICSDECLLESGAVTPEQLDQIKSSDDVDDELFWTEWMED